MSWTFPSDVSGWLRPDEGEALAEVARNRRVLEIGSYCGRSTICMAQTAQKVHALDWGRGDAGAGWDWTTPSLLRNLARYGVSDRVVVHVGRTADVGPVLATDAFDMAFIDGAHDTPSVLTDLDVAIRVLKANGVLAFHDWNYESVQAAAAQRLGWYPTDREGLTVGGTLYIRGLPT